MTSSQTPTVSTNIPLSKPSAEPKRVHVVPPNDNIAPVTIPTTHRDNVTGPHVINTLEDENDDLDYYPCCNVDISTSPYKDVIEIKMGANGNHSTRGLQLTMPATHLNTVQIVECIRSTPAMRIKNWQSQLKGNRLLKINGIPMTSISDVETFFSSLDSHTKEVTLTVGQLEKPAMNVDDGLPMMYFDQLATVSTHLHNIKHDINGTVIPDDLNRNKDVQGPILINMMKAYLKEGTTQAAKAAIPKAILPKSKRRGEKLT